MLYDKELTGQIIGAAIEVHRELGPGLLESAYQACLAHELRLRSLDVESEIPQPVEYKGKQVEVGYRLDMLVEGCVIVENKTVERLLPIHQAQLLTYMKLRGCKLGYLINWNVSLIKNGIKRMVLDYRPDLKST